MASNLFIKYALSGMSMSYKIFGKRLTNFVIEKSAGGLFTSGTSVESLLKDIETIK
jgi:hypothetical protein